MSPKRAMTAPERETIAAMRNMAQALLENAFSLEEEGSGLVDVAVFYLHAGHTLRDLAVTLEATGWSALGSLNQLPAWIDADHLGQMMATGATPEELSAYIEEARKQGGDDALQGP